MYLIIRRHLPKKLKSRKASAPLGTASFHSLITLDNSREESAWIMDSRCTPTAIRQCQITSPTAVSPVIFTNLNCSHSYLENSIPKRFCLIYKSYATLMPYRKDTMKRLIHYSHFLQILFFTIVSALVLSSCHNHSSGGNNETTPSAGESDSYPFIPGLILNMQFCPGGTEVPMETDNSGSSTVNAFWIGETEVTYALWSTVYNWATAGIGSGTGEGEYSFQNEGYPGAGIGNSIEHPATNINWRDAMVFCNSITEYCNSKCGTDFNPVYTTSASFITPNGIQGMETRLFATRLSATRMLMVFAFLKVLNGNVRQDISTDSTGLLAIMSVVMKADLAICHPVIPVLGDYLSQQFSEITLYIVRIPACIRLRFSARAVIIAITWAVMIWAGMLGSGVSPFMRQLGSNGAGVLFMMPDSFDAGMSQPVSRI